MNGVKQIAVGSRFNIYAQKGTVIYAYLESYKLFEIADMAKVSTNGTVKHITASASGEVYVMIDSDGKKTYHLYKLSQASAFSPFHITQIELYTDREKVKAWPYSTISCAISSMMVSVEYQKDTSSIYINNGWDGLSYLPLYSKVWNPKTNTSKAGSTVPGPIQSIEIGAEMTLVVLDAKNEAWIGKAPTTF